MNRKVLAIALLVTFAALLYAQDNKTVSLNGYLIDNMCAGKHVHDKDFAEKVKRHTTSCALEEVCADSGFAVFTDGKLYKFDQAGNSSAEELLRSTKTQKGVQVKVEGTLDGDTIHVTKLSEITETSQ